MTALCEKIESLAARRRTLGFDEMHAVLVEAGFSLVQVAAYVTPLYTHPALPDPISVKVAKPLGGGTVRSCLRALRDVGRCDDG